MSGGEAGVGFRQADNGAQGYDVVLSRYDGAVKLAKRPYSVLGPASMTFNLGQTYHVKVEVEGDTMDVDVGGGWKFQVVDSSYASRRGSGLRSSSPSPSSTNLSAIEVRK